MSLIERIFTEVPKVLWEDLRKESVNSRWLKYGWWNNKFYKRGLQTNGLVEQQGRRGEIEIPYRRRVFYPCPNGRFSLGDIPVAYFSNGILTNSCETIEEFRNNPDLSWEEDLTEYLDGKRDPTPNLMGYAMRFKIVDDALLLDLTAKSNLLIKFIESCDPLSQKRNFFDDVILSREASVYKDTQVIAIATFHHGFDGLVYKSVRKPAVNIPDSNLVMFTESKTIDVSFTSTI